MDWSNNSIDSWGPGPFKLMVADQFQRTYNPNEIKRFYPKNC